MGDCPHGLTANTFLVCCIVLLMYQWTTLSQVFCWMQSLYPGRGWTCVLNSSSESQLSTEAEESWIVFLNFLGFIWLLFFRFTVCNRHMESKMNTNFFAELSLGTGQVWKHCVRWVCMFAGVFTAWSHWTTVSGCSLSKSVSLEATQMAGLKLCL